MNVVREKTDSMQEQIVTFVVFGEIGEAMT